jgi:hypothetical protein
MSRVPLFLLVSSFAIALYSCNNDEPIKPTSPLPLDTTSHAYTWTIDTLGGFLSQVTGVFAFSDTDAWASGTFYVYDSAGVRQAKRDCNAAHWDGKTWTLLRVEPMFHGSPAFGYTEDVCGTSPDDIWLTPGCHFDGKRWTVHDMNLAPGRILRSWGSRPDNWYFVGEKGSIVHWNGSEMKEIGEKTTAACRDVWGRGDTVMVAVSDYDLVSMRPGYILRIVNGNIIGKELISPNGNPISIWQNDGIWYTAGCSSVFMYNGVQWADVKYLDRCFIGIRGTARNDVCFTMENGKTIHFNGKSWSTILEPIIPQYWCMCLAVAGRMVLVGGRQDYGLILRGTHL